MLVNVALSVEIRISTWNVSFNLIEKSFLVFRFGFKLDLWQVDVQIRGRFRLYKESYANFFVQSERQLVIAAPLLALNE